MIATSAGIRHIAHIDRFLGVDAVLSPNEVRRGDDILAVVVWGRKETAEAGISYAKDIDSPVLYLEDGWVRSASKSAHSRRMYSLLVDDLGVYYDATQPSRIEQLLNLEGAEFQAMCPDEALQYAAQCRQRLVDSDITKYNYCRRARIPQHNEPFVLVIDQTFADASVRLGGMVREDFLHMLHLAVKENPNANVVVRTHPDVVAGLQKGYLTEAAKSQGITISAEGDNPIPWLKAAERVYVGTSQMGYEALLCETPVSVFGQPFYAGWGLTDDRYRTPALSARRKQKRTLDELFHVAHIELARYINPVDGSEWQLHDCLEHVKLQKDYFAKNAKEFHCVGITPWKRGYIRQYLRSPDGSVSFGTKPRSRHIQKDVLPVSKSPTDCLQPTQPISDVVPPAQPVSDVVQPSQSKSDDTQHAQLASKAVDATWSFRHFNDDSPEGSEGASAQKAPVYRLEDGFLRSAGLGSDFTPPGSLVVDATGLYFDPSGPSDLENLLNTADLSLPQVQRAQRLRQRILVADLTKYNVGKRVKRFAKPAVNRNVLVVGQVEDDASIQKGCTDVSDNTALLQAVRLANPEAYVVYKPHPDVLAGNRKGAVENPLNWADEVNTTSSITAGLEWCQELHTMTSLAGFEALMRGRSVTTYGLPFYAGWGLTDDKQTCTRRTRRRTLDELVYLTLIEYPRYLDVQSGEFMSPEMMLSRLEEHRSVANEEVHWMQRQMTKVANLVKGCRYEP